MNKKLLTIFVIIFAVFLLIIFMTFSSGITPNQCTIAQSCPSNTVAIFSVYKQNDAHAAQNINYYDYKVCCPQVTGNDCNAAKKDILVNLLYSVDSHVEKKDLGNYNNPVCISTTATGSVTCSYKQSCTADELCVVSIYQATNAHVGSCGYYNINVCCEICENKITMKCATVKNPPGETKPEIPSCNANYPNYKNVNDKACCPKNTDCVYNNACYTDDLNPSTKEKTINGDDLTCSSGTWCPVGFEAEKDPSTGKTFCKYEEQPCYPSPCPFPHNDSRWWTNKDCINKDTGWCCCPSGIKWNGIEFYKKSKIIVY